jgi:tetratricopeptide (TPR) repeat protein
MRSRGWRAAQVSPGAWLVLILFVSAALCHGFLFWAPFIYDDQAFVLFDPKITGAWPGWKAFFGGTFAGPGEYGPLVPLAHWALYRLCGAVVWPYRLTSLLLHWANVWLVWKLFRRWLKDERLALAGAALFAVFPAHVEVLALTSFKKHLAVALFGLALLDVQHEEKLGVRARAALGGALLALALLCKESGLIFVPLAFAASAARGGHRGLRAERAFLGVLTVTAAVYAAARLTLLPRQPAALVGGAWAPHLATCGKILLWHLGELAFPVDLAIEHGLAPVRSFGEGALVSFGVLAWLGLGVLLARRDRVAAFGWAWITLALAPFLNLIPFLNFSLVANRYEYLATAGFFLLAARLAAPFLRPAAAGGARRVLLAVALPFGFYAGESALFAARFTSPMELWSDALARSPDHPRALGALGALKLSWHDDAGAEADLRAALARAPQMSQPYVSLSLLLAETGRVDEALEFARRLLALRPDSTAWANLGFLYMRSGRFAEALEPLEKAAFLAPGPDAALALGQCLIALRRYDEADSDLRAALADPALRASVLRAQGDAALARGRGDEAENDWRASLAVDPLQPETVDSLSRALARDGRRAEAIALYDDLLARLRRVSDDLTTETPEQKNALDAYLSGRLAEVGRKRAALTREPAQR